MGTCCLKSDDNAPHEVPPIDPHRPAMPLRIVTTEVKSDKTIRELKLHQLDGAYPYAATALLHDADANWVAQRDCIYEFYWRGGPTIHAFVRRRLPAHGIVVLQKTVL